MLKVKFHKSAPIVYPAGHIRYLSLTVGCSSILLEIMTSNLLFLMVLVALNVSSISSLEESFLVSDCSTMNGNSYTANDAFATNLNILLEKLKEHSRSSLDSYFKTNVGTNSADRVYGDVLCRGDVNGPVCANCVELAANEVTKKCSSFPKIATVWYDHCKLSYSSQEIPGVDDYSGKHLNQTSMTMTMTSPMRDAVRKFLNNLASEAVNDRDKHFKTGELKYSRRVTFYGLVQCIENEAEKCRSCLNSAIIDGNGSDSIVSYRCSVRVDRNSKFFDSRPDLEFTLYRNKNRKLIVTLSVVSAIAALVVVSAVYVVRRIRQLEGRERRRLEVIKVLNPLNEIVAEPNGNFVSVEGMKMDYSTLSEATGGFSQANELGRGAFGIVYRGVLPDGKEIAAKRLSRESWDGIKHFKNEIDLLLKIQHNNLVRLLGCAIEVKEKVLVYEYMENNSLHNFIFDAEKRATLNWETCSGIIKGIARGLIYLHEESRVPILHRDLKPDNVLLDKDMVAKISDFGIARIIDSKHDSLITTKPLGTFGYMAPEYAMNGEQSEKIDVFSFGVIVLEMLSGRRNNYVRPLLTYAWKLWMDGKQAEFLETPFKESPCQKEILRCMQIGLLCVQERPQERPLMSSVYLLLSEPTLLPQPKKPPTYVGRQTVLPVSLSNC